MSDHPRVYADVVIRDGMIVVDGEEWMIDCVDVYPEREGYVRDATAHLSLVSEQE